MTGGPRRARRVRVVRKPRFEPFQDVSGKWRWRLIGANGKKVASSGESFDSRRNAVLAMLRVRHIAREAELPPEIKEALVRLAAKPLPRRQVARRITR
jgi:uncharacterized protein